MGYQNYPVQTDDDIYERAEQIAERGFLGRVVDALVGVPAQPYTPPAVSRPEEITGGCSGAACGQEMTYYREPEPGEYPAQASGQTAYSTVYDGEPLTVGGVIKGLLFLGAGLLLIMALSEWGII